MKNFIDDHILAIITILIGIFFALLIFTIWRVNANCIAGHNTPPIYHAPTYIVAGKVLVPIDGGTYSDFVCDEWK